MLRIKNLTKTYKSKKGAAVKALDNVSADFDNKGMVFILGKSGGGKSTLLNLLGGLDAPDSGEIIFKGKSCKSFSPSDYDSYRNTYVGFVFQEYNLIDSYSVGNNIGLAPELQGKHADRNQIETVLRKVDLVGSQGETLYDRRTNELSAGQKQRVSIARALIKNPEIILADEPTGALDSETGRQLYELLKILAQEKLIIVVTHDQESAEKYGDRIFELKDGVIVKDITKGAGGFAVTKTKKDTEKTDDCKFIKSRLPFRRGFAMGASGLKVKKFRLFTSIFLSAVTFIIFGFSFTAATADKYTAELKTLNAHDMRMIAITSDSYYRHFSPGRGEFINSEIHHLADPQLEEIKKYSGSADLMIISDYYYISALMPFFDHLGENKERLEYLSDSSNPYLKYALRYGSVAELDPGTGEADANLKPDGRFLDKNLCRLPKDFGEIAITDLKADMFMRFGYKSEDGMIKDIKTPDDLIGKKIGELIICGVYSTEGDNAYFEQYDTGYNVFDNNYLRSYLEGSHIANYTFAYKGFGFYHYNLQPHHNPEHYPIGQVLIKLSGNPGKDRALFNKLTYKDNDSSFTGSNNNFYSARIMSSFSGFVDELYYVTEYGAPIGLIVAAVFSVFAALLMMNFLNVSIDFKKKELGILRALGARRKDVLTVCLTESLIIACINIIISLAAVLILCFAFNRYFYLSIFNMGFLQIALLFLLCFGVAALATVIPVTRITNKKPIDIINNK